MGVPGGKADVSDKGCCSANIELICQPEIYQLQLVVAKLNHYVFGLQIPMQVPALVQVFQGRDHLMRDQGHSLEGELLLALDEEFFQVFVQFLHDYVGVFIEFFKGVDSGEMGQAIEFQEDVELFLDEDDFLDVHQSTLPWFFSILQA